MAQHRVLQISDTHLLADPGELLYRRPVTANLAATLSAAAHQGPFDLVLLTGDISEDGSPESYSRIHDMLAELDHGRVLAVPGNHDAPAVMGEVFQGIPTELGNWRILPVNSHWPGHPEGKIEASELARLSTTLEQIDQEPSPAYALVAVHHPPHFLCSNEVCSLTNPEPLLELTARDCVRLVVSGHVHDDYAHRIGSTLFSTCPSTCIGFDHNPNGHRASSLPPGAVIYDLFDDGSVGRRAVYAAP
jgi:3',5'-cyclic-AMP phosphodiesterase